MNFNEFIKEYFIEPMYTGEGYNLPNTIVYGILLGIGVIVSYKIIKNLKITIDRVFLITLIPYLFTGSTIRALTDAEILPKIFPFLTPGIFFTMFLIYMPILVLSVKLNIYPRLVTTAGVMLSIYPTILLIQNIKYFNVIIYFIFYLLILSLILIPLYYFKIDKMFLIVIFVHIIDLSSTLVAINHFNYFEVHYFENILINKFNTSLILIPIKFLVLFLAYKILSFLNFDERRFWYVALFILGFSPGFRDLFKVMLLG